MKFVHVVYRTRRFQEMIRWYENVFAAKVQYQNPVLAFLTYDDEHHRFAFANLDVLKPDGGDARGEVGVNHVAYTYANVGDLLDTYRRLKARGVVLRMLSMLSMANILDALKLMEKSMNIRDLEVGVNIDIHLRNLLL